jgi:tRNA threonylcarbamoyladenosine biosynthesis protein TsaB
MLTLAFDTATMWGRFALAENGQVLQYRPLNVSGSYADSLLLVMQEMLAEAGRSRSDLEAVAVTVGPGSFTGVRIGVATAKGLAWGLGCRLHATTSLEAMAGALLAEHPDAEAAVPVLDARRGEIFAGYYRRRDGWVEPVAEPAALKPDQWWDRIKGLAPDVDQPVYGGDGTALLLGQGETLRPELASRGEPVLRRWTTAHPATAPALAAAVSSGDPLLEAVHPFTLVPRYLRGSDAELKKKINLTPDTPSTEIASFSSRKDRS